MMLVGFGTALASLQVEGSGDCPTRGVPTESSVAPHTQQSADHLAAMAVVHSQPLSPRPRGTEANSALPILGGQQNLVLFGRCPKPLQRLPAVHGMVPCRILCPGAPVPLRLASAAFLKVDPWACPCWPTRGQLLDDAGGGRGCRLGGSSGDGPVGRPPTRCWAKRLTGTHIQVCRQGGGCQLPNGGMVHYSTPLPLRARPTYLGLEYLWVPLRGTYLSTISPYGGSGRPVHPHPTGSIRTYTTSLMWGVGGWLGGRGTLGNPFERVWGVRGPGPSLILCAS